MSVRKIRITASQRHKFVPITLAELKAAIAKTATGKAAGEDEVFAEELRHLPEHAVCTLRDILNESLRSGNVPMIFRMSIIVPLLKAGKDGMSLKDFRPIALTCVISKVMERVLVTRLWHRFTPHYYQYAYRKHLGTEDALIALREFFIQSITTYKTWWYQKKNSEKLQKGARCLRTMAVLFDFSSAFDTICHDVNAKILKSVDPVGFEARWMRNLLRGRRGKVRMNGKYVGKSAAFTAGVPQGSVVGPALFLLYVNPLLEKLQKAGFVALMYADDLTILLEGQTQEEMRPKAQQAIDIVTSWAKSVSMKINAEKCEGIVMTLSSHTKEDKADIPLKIEGKKMNMCRMGEKQVVKLLGMTLDNRFNTNEHMHRTAKSCQLRVAQLTSIAGATFGPNTKDQRTIARGYVESKLLYGASVYGVPKSKEDRAEIRASVNDLRIRHCAALRTATGVLASTDVESQMLEANCLPFEQLMMLKTIYAHEKHLSTRPTCTQIQSPRPQARE